MVANSVPLTGNSSEIELVDMGYDLLTPTNAIIAYTELLITYAEGEVAVQECLPDLEKMMTAGTQLAALIHRFFARNKPIVVDSDVESLSSTIRHDLRTPINAILGYGEMLIEDLDSTDQSDMCADLQRILTTARRLLTQINDLTHASLSTMETFKAAESARNKLNNEIKNTEAVAEPITVSTAVSAAAANNVPSVVLTPRFQTVDISLQDAKLLVVDDKESNRDLLMRRLERQGFQIETAENGVQALEKLAKNTYDLVLLDVIMPEMDGFQVLERIKNDQKFCHLPVIMISALDEIESVVRCIEMGAEDFLQKPFNQVILNAKISATLERKRLRDREQAFMQKLQQEQEKSERLLLNVLPKPIADRLKKGENTIADTFPEVTVLFCDLVKFTELSAGISATQLVDWLNDIFYSFDILADLHGLEKIKTIGDAYMLVGGLPMPRLDHAEAVANMAIDMFDAIERLNKQRNSNFMIRVGIHTGPVVAGIIGKTKFSYDLWGDAVNIASRMESQGIPGKIQISERCHNILQDKFIFEKRGAIDIKGRGQMTTYILLNRKE